MALSHNPRIVTDGLVLCLDAANPKSYPGSGNTWFDLSGNGNDGTLVNGVGYDSANNGSMVFDGVDDSIQSSNLAGTIISNPIDNILSFTFFANVLSSSSYYIVSTGGQTSGAAGISFSYQNGSPNAIIKGLNGGFQFYISLQDFPINQWISWGITCNGSVLSVYKNGELLGSQTSQNLSAPPSDGWTTLTIGRPNNVLYNYMANMKFSNLQIYNRALTEAEIKQNFNALRGRYNL